MFIRIEDPRDVSVIQFRSGVDLKVCKDNNDNGRRVECDDQYFMCYKARIECDASNTTAINNSATYIMRGCGKSPEIGMYIRYPQFYSAFSCTRLT